MPVNPNPPREPGQPETRIASEPTRNEARVEPNSKGFAHREPGQPETRIASEPARNAHRASPPGHRGPSKLPPSQRLRLNQRLLYEPWPQRDQKCIEGPPLTWHRGRPQSTPRVLLEEISDCEFHRTWRIRKVCAVDGCINPHHHEVYLINRTTGEPIEPLPMFFISQFERQDLTPDIEECADWLGIINDRSSFSDEQLSERSGGIYPPHIIAEARLRV